MPPSIKLRYNGLANIALLLAAVAALWVTACRKDHFAPFPDQAGRHVRPNYPISVFEAMAHFAGVQGSATNSLNGDNAFVALDPVWSAAYLSQSQSGREIVVVPLADSSLRVLNDGRVDAKLLFSKDGPEEITAEIMVYAADSAYLAGKSNGPEFEDYTGQYMFFDIGFHFKHGIWVDAGVLKGRTMTVERQGTSGIANSRNNNDPVEDCIDHVVSDIVLYKCPDVAVWDCFQFIITTIAVCNDPILGGGSTGGGSGNNNEFNSPLWDVFTGSVPMGIFAQNPALLPPGFDTTLVRQFIDINKMFNFLPQELLALSKNPGYIQVLYDLYAPWVNVPITPENQHNLPNSAHVKAVLAFALQHNLTPEQFEALLLNGALFGQVKALAEGLNLNNTLVKWLIENDEATDILHDFVAIHHSDNTSKSIANTVIQNRLTDIEPDDLDLLYDHPDIYNHYVQFLSNAPNESQENKMTALRLVALAPDHPIADLAARLECFNVTSNTLLNHKVSIFVNQPVANSNASASSKEKAGHTWLTLEQDLGNGNVVTLSVGLYPQSSASPCKQADYGAYNDDQGQPFDVSVTWPVSAYGFNLLVENLKDQPTAPTYMLSHYNCSTFAVEKLNSVLGFGIPETNVVSLPETPLTGACKVIGLAPGQLGQDLRNNYTLPTGATRNTTGGNGPMSSCQ